MGQVRPEAEAKTSAATKADAWSRPGVRPAAHRDQQRENNAENN